MNVVDLPKDHVLAGKVIEGHYKNVDTKLDQGIIGGIFGSRNSAPANVAAIIALTAACFLIIAVVSWAGSPDFLYKDAVSSLSGIVTLTVGYLFGRSSKD